MKMEIQSADYIELSCYALFLYCHIKSSITVSTGTVRLNSQAYSKNDLPSRRNSYCFICVTFLLIYIADLVIFLLAELFLADIITEKSTVWLHLN